jgi:hypothetical protein
VGSHSCYHICRGYGILLKIIILIASEVVGETVPKVVGSYDPYVSAEEVFV